MNKNCRSCRFIETEIGMVGDGYYDPDGFCEIDKDNIKSVYNLVTNTCGQWEPRL